MDAGDWFSVPVEWFGFVLIVLLDRKMVCWARGWWQGVGEVCFGLGARGVEGGVVEWL